MAIIDKRVAVVTGGNKGIGFEICRQLAERGLRVILTSRDVGRGEEACKKLGATSADVVFRQLDVTSDDSVARLVRYLDSEQSRVDVLVNNAGIMIDTPGTGVLETSLEVFRSTLETNFFGALRLCQAIAPVMQRGHYGRIVNVSSGLGQLEQMGDGTAAYRASKAALNALTRMVSAAVSADDILVNSMCPGWVRTDLGGPNAARSPEKGAETAVWLAMLPHGGPSGGFFRDKQAIPW
ncbi:MAG: SDR family oxidoreductase [Burkholderiales bacterium]|jgi:NAD(P)-dependent dehydrogenase (short-subunit alcohol dehydrogenase family)